MISLRSQVMGLTDDQVRLFCMALSHIASSVPNLDIPEEVLRKYVSNCIKDALGDVSEADKRRMDGQHIGPEDIYVMRGYLTRAVLGDMEGLSWVFKFYQKMEALV